MSGEKQQGEKDNKVYFFHPKGIMNGYYFAAKNFKKAKGMALKTELTEWSDNPFIDIRGNIVKRYYKDGEYIENGYIIETNYEGKLNVKQEGELGILWFQCPECGDDDFSFSEFTGGDYMAMKCNQCGYESDVPYGEF